jgi:hypothetical protein
MTRKEREGSKVPMPGPIPAIHLKPKASNKEIEQDFDTFEFQALVDRTPHHPRRLSLSTTSADLPARSKARSSTCTRSKTPTAKNSSTSKSLSINT